MLDLENKDLGQISCGGLGAHDFWERNTKKAERDGFKTRCNHCGKGMVEDTGWIAVWYWGNDSFYPLAIKDEVLAAGGEIVRLGNTCAKEWFYDNTKETHFEKVSEAK